MSKNLRALSARQIDDETLFEAPSEAAEADGSPSDEQLQALAHERLVSPASLLGTSSFYDFLRRDNRGKRGYIPCAGVGLARLEIYVICIHPYTEHHSHD